ncbi:MAG TPA: C10 family peptidase [Bacteroidales bacterium]|nr:C10 family peptidase [Bacteroidales bacterium]HPS62864.1 C10 family peptidase [Bacteroidales bacterium]
MKKTILSVVFLFLLLSGALAKKVEITRAGQAGKNFYYQQISRIASTDFSTLKITRSYTESENGTPLFYVFDINDHGFVMVAADDASIPVLGYSFESAFKADDQGDNFRYWKNNYKEQILAIIQQRMQPDRAISESWSNLLDATVSLPDNTGSNTDVLPMLTSNWDQGAPYNSMCPPDPAGPGGHVLVGCVATAMSQVMYYWRYPLTGQGSHCDSHSYNGQQYCANFGTTTYDWNGAVNQPVKECDPVALMSFHAGVSVNMNYGVSASGAYSSSIPNALKNYFKYSTSLYYQQRITNYTTWVNQIKADLDALRPVIYGGSGPDGGHCFVCDGYQANDMFHFNWGWSGSNNGYYTINNLNPGGMTFNSGQDAVFNIQPDVAQYPFFCSGATNVATYGFGTIEDGSGPVANYNANANCSWLIGPDDSIKSITLVFEKFNVGAGDEVKVYDGATSSAPLLGIFTGNSIPAAVTSTGSQMLVTFTSDNATEGEGWMADYTCEYTNFCESVTTLSDLSGSFTDGSGRFDYRNSNICKWKIMPACYNIGSTSLSFSNFSTEQDNDKVQVYNQANGALLATYSGTYTIPPTPVTSPSGKFLVIFTTNASVRGEGWSASYNVDCLNVGMEEPAISDVSLYPNPARDRVTLAFTVKDLQSLKIAITDARGETVYTSAAGKVQGRFERTVDVSGLSKGFYMVRITGEKSVYQAKLVIN